MRKLNKKNLKAAINKRGSFMQVPIRIEKNVPEAYTSQVPEGAMYFEGIVSTGEVNRNGYIIRPQALVDAMPDFMKNPVILLQHDTDQPIGQALDARMVDGGQVWVCGFIFDDLTENRFSKNLFKALSTGHITLSVEFENQESKEVITEEEYIVRRDKGEIGWNDQKWVLAVTKLEWVEFSLVAIGSNRDSMVGKNDAIGAYLENGILSDNAIDEYMKERAGKKVEDNTVDETASEEKADEPEIAGETPADGEESGETPAEETPEGSTEVKTEEVESENKTEGEEQNKIVISVADRAKLQAMAETAKILLDSTLAADEGEEHEAEDAKVEPEAKVEENKTETKVEETKVEENVLPMPANEVKELIRQLAIIADTRGNELSKAMDEIATLKKVVENIPARKAMIIQSQFQKAEDVEKDKNSKATQSLLNLFESVGLVV